MTIKIILLILFLQNSFSMVIFPFKTAIYDKGEINQNNIEYNTSNFVDDYTFQPSYITLKIGNPPQEIKILLPFNDCGFKIGKSNKCIYDDEYLSHYNRNLSTDFKYTNEINKTNYEFIKGKSAEESIYAYTDLALENLQKFDEIGFFLGTDTNDALCGIIGFSPDTYKSQCTNVNYIFNSFNSKEIIKSDSWMLKYNSQNEGLLIFDPELDKIFEKYDSNKLFIANSEKALSTISTWTIIIDKIFSEDYNETINKKDLKAEINNDFGFMEGSGDYYYYITKTFFKDYIKKRICYLNDVHVNVYYYFTIECDKDKFGIEDLKKFPSLSLVSVTFQKEFIFDYKDLFTETKYKYFFNIIFNVYITERWILGKPFLRKYPFIINYYLKTIAYYNEDIEPDTTDYDNNKDNNSYLSEKNLFILIIIVFLLIVISGITFFYVGKTFNKIRKKRANELKDDYFDYNPSNDNKKNLFDEQPDKENSSSSN